MTERPAALDVLSTKLCPWLRPIFDGLEAARAAGRLGHAWLIAGPAGTGKLNLALTFADRLLRGAPTALVPQAIEPVGLVAAMRERHAPVDHHPDLHRLFPEEDKRTISVEQVRAISESLALKAYRGAAKVVVVEPADAMTIAAANGLLKTLEEPAGDAYLLLVSDTPERLPPTIRSRCQRVNVARPAPAALATWLGRDLEAIEPLWLSAGGSPRRVAELLADGEPSITNDLEDKLILVSKGGIDPQSVADEWFKLDCDLVLSWLVRRIHLALRSRLAPGASNAITDRDTDPLHNAWHALTLRRLFDQHRAAERLLNQLGAGVNVELALRALLLGFAR